VASVVNAFNARLPARFSRITHAAQKAALLNLIGTNDVNGLADDVIVNVYKQARNVMTTRGRHEASMQGLIINGPLGGAATTKPCICIRTGSFRGIPVCLKTYTEAEDIDRRGDSLTLEVEVSGALEASRSVVQVLGPFHCVIGGNQTSSVVMPPFPYDLKTYLQMTAKPDHVTVEVIRWYLVDVGRGILDLVRANYVHCDIKPSNIVVEAPASSALETSRPRFVIIDLGSCRKLTDVGGTMEYTPPYDYDFASPQSMAIDVAGMLGVAVELRTGEQQSSWEMVGQGAELQSQIYDSGRVRRLFEKVHILWKTCRHEDYAEVGIGGFEGSIYKAVVDFVDVLEHEDFWEGADDE